MELKNEFRVSVPVERAWATLTDVEYIAPCMPGAQLTEIDGDDFKGQVKVKVGPITAQYKGSAKFLQKIEEEHRVILEATGRDTRGAGNASAEVTAEMVADGEGTKITISTNLKVTGKVAQFGRGVMADVSEKLIGQFVDSLEKKLSEEISADTVVVEEKGNTDSGSEEQPEKPEGPRVIDMPEPEPVDLLDTAAAPMLKRFGPFVIAGLLLILFSRRKR
ncbi:MAG: SRPBCC family protein [Actinomycetota bacterium]|nr:SRPBCC family protein [Actinomycetota bacterium]MDG1490152.1 SRPBCC family protein [Actinomycetota bacterium]MDG2121656.1 SRPBCC family protein [Actinomycetota bacterium]